MEKSLDTSSRLTLNVGGQNFMTTTDTLCSLPDTRLGRLAKETADNPHHNGELFFDRNPDIMNSLLDFYRKGELHLPRHLCGRTVEEELKFWEIPVEVIHQCCYKSVDTYKEDAEIIQEIDKFLTNPYETEAAIAKLSTWNKVWLMMERPNLCRASRIWSTFFFMVVLLSVLVYTMASSMTFRTYRDSIATRASNLNLTLVALTSIFNLKQQFFASEPSTWLYALEQIFFAIFIVEFVARLATCPSKAFFFRMGRSWFDLFLLVQHAVSLVVDTTLLEDNVDYNDPQRNAFIFLQCLSILRVMRVFYLAKDFEASKVLVLSTRASLKDLALLAISLLSMATMFGALVYMVELLEEGFTFHSILYGMWYAIVTMTTVGYGDYYPVTTSGRLVGALCALSGLIVIALPVTIIASKFSSYHDNYTTRQQMKDRLTFFKDNPGFCTRLHEGVCGDDHVLSDKSETKGVKSHTETTSDGVTSHTETTSDGVKSHTETTSDGVKSHTETTSDGVTSHTETTSDGVTSHTETTSDGVTSHLYRYANSEHTGSRSGSAKWDLNRVQNLEIKAAHDHNES